MPAALSADLLIRREGISMLAGAGLISSRTGAGSCLSFQQSFLEPSAFADTASHENQDRGRRPHGGHQFPQPPCEGHQPIHRASRDHHVSSTVSSPCHRFLIFLIAKTASLQDDSACAPTLGCCQGCWEPSFASTLVAVISVKDCEGTS